MIKRWISSLFATNLEKREETTSLSEFIAQEKYLPQEIKEQLATVCLNLNIQGEDIRSFLECCAKAGYTLQKNRTRVQFMSWSTIFPDIEESTHE